MSNAINNVVSAFSIKGSAIARRVLAVGLAQRDGQDEGKKAPAATVFEAVTAQANAAGTILDRWSGSTCANAATSFDLYVSTGLPIPNTSNTTDGTILGIAGLVEQARVKHGKKAVAETIKVAVGTVTEYDTTADRAAKVADHLEALIGLDAEVKSPSGQTPAQRFMSALRAADTLAFEVELSDDDVTEALRLIASITATAESWA